MIRSLVRALADGVQLGLRTIGWGEPTDPCVVGWSSHLGDLMEKEAAEEVHPPRCNCFSADRVDEFVDTAIENLNDLLEKFAPKITKVVVPEAHVGPITLTRDELINAAYAIGQFADNSVGQVAAADRYLQLARKLRSVADVMKGEGA